MTGLLYQDFCTAKGKWMLRILAACVLILIGMVIWGTRMEWTEPFSWQF